MSHTLARDCLCIS